MWYLGRYAFSHVLIRETLEETRGDKSLAAQLLGIAPRTIYRRLEAEKKRSQDED